MKSLFLINSTSLGANYGVGTYIHQLADSFRHPDIRLNVVHLRAQGN